MLCWRRWHKCEREKKREREILYISQLNLIFWIHHPSLMLPLPLDTASYCLFALQQKRRMLFFHAVCVYAAALYPCYIMTKRTESLSLVCLCLFLRALRRCFFFLFAFVFVEKKKFYFGATFESVQERSLLIARKLIASICHSYPRPRIACEVNSTCELFCIPGAEKLCKKEKLLSGRIFIKFLVLSNVAEKQKRKKNKNQDLKSEMY